MIDVLTSKRFWKEFDWFLVLVALLLCTIGLIEIYSATLNMESASYFLRQVAWVGIGICIMFAVASLDYRVLGENVFLIYGLFIVLLVSVLLFGDSISGARSWFRVGVKTVGWPRAPMKRAGQLSQMISNTLGLFISSAYLNLCLQ